MMQGSGIESFPIEAGNFLQIVYIVHSLYNDNNNVIVMYMNLEVRPSAKFLFTKRTSFN